MNLAETMRPKTLDEVIGNEHILLPLAKQLRDESLSQSIMITGKYGSGKTTLAKIIAGHLNAEVHEIDCGSDGGVDKMREVVEASQLSSLFAKVKVFILDEVHGLSKQAQSALLKTLEEPRANLYFILLTTDTSKILPTIRSRCVLYETKPATTAEIGVAVKRVLDKYGLEVEDMADFWSLVHQSDGSLRQVYAIMEKLVASADSSGHLSSETFKKVLGTFGPEEVDERLPQAFLAGDLNRVMEIVKNIKKEGNVIGTCIGLYNYLKTAYLNSQKGSRELLTELSLMLATKQIEWEHLEYLAWKYAKPS